MMSSMRSLIFLGAMVAAQNLFGVSPDVLKYPAISSSTPNKCTEKWGAKYFLRSNGFCQACSTVGKEYKIYYGICEYVDSISLKKGQPIELSCGDKYPKESLTICKLEQEIASAQIIKEDSAPGVKCSFNKTWGHNQDYIWTTKGCHATFRVCLNDGVCKLEVIKTEAPAKVCQKYRPRGWISYKVRSGDTLSALAARTGTWTSKLKEVNCITNVNQIFVGTYLYLPRYPRAVIPVVPDDSVIITPIEDDGQSGGRDPIDPGNNIPDDMVIIME